VPEFADFAPGQGADPWHATIGPLREHHVEDVARIYGGRQGDDIASAVAVVRGWLDDPQRLVVVAEHELEVRGYASATLLDVTAPDGSDASGWYLSGVAIDPSSRRHRIGAQLTSARLERLSEVTDSVWYFTNARNLASIALHARYGFVEHGRGPRIGGVDFEGGTGILFRRAL
jgi:aminoglycoside 6'-N-acetyltransferase I